MKPKDHPLPSNVSAEKAILGAVLLDNALFEATAPLEADDFSLDAHRAIYLHIAEMMERGEGVDPVTLVEDLRAAKDLERVGESPVAYINDLSADTIRFRPSVRDWVRIVKAKSLQRKLIGVCTSAANKAWEGESGFTIISVLRDHLDEIESSARKGMRS